MYVYSERKVNLFPMGREDWKPTLQIDVKKTMPKPAKIWHVNKVFYWWRIRPKINLFLLLKATTSNLALNLRLNSKAFKKQGFLGMRTQQNITWILFSKSPDSPPLFDKFVHLRINLLVSTNNSLIQAPRYYGQLYSGLKEKLPESFSVLKEALW